MNQARGLEDVASCLDLFPVLAFVTDPCNRVVRVNRTFARAVGDPVRDRLPPAARFVPAMVAGPYRERFPRWKEEISTCLASLYQQVDAGNLGDETLQLIEETLNADEELRRAAARTGRCWDGTMVVRDHEGRMTMVREQVLPVHDPAGRASGCHVSLWFPAEQDHSSETASVLTPRQLEIARLYASGMTADEVAAAAHISWRTARAHLEEIYARLGVHSRAELALVLSRAGAV